MRLSPVRFLIAFVFIFGLMAAIEPALGDSVTACQVKFKKPKSNPKAAKIKVHECRLELAEAGIGDIVVVKDESNREVASGKVFKKVGRYGMVNFKDVSKEPKTGYPVQVKNSDNIDYWTATTAPF